MHTIILIALVRTLRSDLLKRNYNVGLAPLHRGKAPSDEFATGLVTGIVTPLNIISVQKHKCKKEAKFGTNDIRGCRLHRQKS